MRKTRRQIRRKRRFFPGSNVAIDEIEVPELEDWMVAGGK
jgi:hypothetical protein